MVYTEGERSNDPWWRQQMETFSALLILCEENPHKGQRQGALMFSLICDWTSGWANTRDAGDLRRHRVHYDVTVMAKTDDTFRENNAAHDRAAFQYFKRWSVVFLIIANC